MPLTMVVRYYSEDYKMLLIMHIGPRFPVRRQTPQKMIEAEPYSFGLVKKVEALLKG